MVLLNGVKYACERCIRGHRVSSCTHTDKPLTMIKPKGRPASQCLHCREQRKQRSAHNSCTCGKKGKSPGQHFASCLCHKNSVCTCSKEKKPRKKRDNDAAVPEAAASEIDDLLIEDIAIPFEADFGLLDCFSPRSVSSARNKSPKQSKADISETPAVSHNSDRIDEQAFSLNFANPPSDAELDMMENMFPLFPLVGSSSFSDNSSLPLSAISKSTPRERQGSPSQSTAQSQSNSSNQQLNQQSNQQFNQQMSHTSSYPNTSLSRGRSESQTTQLNTHNSGQGPYHPKPLRASASFDGTTTYAQNINGSANFGARRPESALSATSSSSNTSRQNLFEHASYTMPKAVSSAAFPPFNSSENNSHDDIASLFYPVAGMHNEPRSLSLASDEDAFKLHSATPVSSLPSRQPSQRRKSSLTRFSHQNSPASHAVAAHALGKEKATSSESPPNQGSRRSPSVDPSRMNRIDSDLREVSEETPAILADMNAKYTLGPLETVEQNGNLAFDLPMYSELLEYTPN